MPKTRTVQEIPFSDIAGDFQLGEYWFGAKWCPAVTKDDRGYRIRVVKSETRSSGNNVGTTYDYFELSEDGTVLVAPRGFARDYKPGRVIGIDQAVADHANAPAGARRITF